MDREQLLDHYDDIYETIYKDEELMLKVLVNMFGSVDEIWGIIHTHYTGINEHRDLDDEDLEREVNYVVNAYRKAVDDMVEKEVLDE